MPAMTPERWRLVESVLDAVLDAPPDARAPLLDARCAGDPALRAEVERLVAACDAPPSGVIPDAPAEEFAASLVALDHALDRALDDGDDTAGGQASPVAPRERVGPWRLVREAGEGGMGTVYEAERDDGQFRKRVALKLVRPGLHLDDRFVRRFVEERRILARLEHPNVARILDGGVTDDGLPYYVMEYVDGEPIDRWCDARRLGVDERLALFCKVCRAVSYAHERGVVHRDLKPSNILVGADGEPKLLDFGIAKLLRGGTPGATQGLADHEHPAPALTRTGQRMLTPAYASPEQVRGEEVSGASDVYTLGVILYELLTGRRPYRAADRDAARDPRRDPVREMERAILEEEPRRPSTAAARAGDGAPSPLAASGARATTPDRLRRRLRGDLDAIVLAALRKEPARRYPSPDALAADLRRHLDGLPVSARADAAAVRAAAYRLRKLARRHRATLAAGAVGMVAGVALIAAGARAWRLRGADGGGRLVAGATRRVAFSAALELDPAPSPDGRRVAYVADGGGAMRLYVKDVGREAATPLGASLPGHHRAPRWSPDGTRLAFQVDGVIWVVDAAGGEPRALVRPEGGARRVGSPAWSPDGREIAYAEGRAVRVRPAAGGAARTVAELPDEPHSLAWSPDGRWLALVERNATFVFGYRSLGSTVNLGNAAPSAIWVVPARGGAPVRVTDDRRLNTSPVWLPGERALLFVSNRDGERDVYRVALADDGRPDGEPERITTGLGAHTIGVTPDGRSLAFATFRSVANVWAVPIPARGAVDDAAAVPVTTGQQSIEGFAVSPDGRWLAFDSDRDGGHRVYRAPTAGGDAVALTARPPDGPADGPAGEQFMPRWSPDGRELAFYFYAARDGAQLLGVVPAAGGAVRAVVAAPRIQRLPDWSPDGRSILFTTDRPDPLDLWVVSRDAAGRWGAARQLTRDGGWSGRWSPDGRSILYGRPDGLWVMDADGARRRKLVARDTTEVSNVGVAVWSRDGATVFYKQFDTAGRPSIRAVPAAGGASRLVVRFAESRQSPRPEIAVDGARLYFTIAERQSDVGVMSLERARR